MNCPKCGAPLAEGTAFCTSCGAPCGQPTATRQPAGSINSNEALRVVMSFNLVAVLGAILMFISLFLPFITSDWTSKAITLGGENGLDCPTIVWLYAILIVAILVCILLKKEKFISYLTLIPFGGYIGLIDYLGDSSDGWGIGWWFMIIGSIICLVSGFAWKRIRPLIKI